MTQDTDNSNQTTQTTDTVTDRTGVAEIPMQGTTSAEFKMYGTDKSQEQTKQPAPDNAPKGKIFTESEVTEMILKARSDEKNKVFSKLEALKDEKSKSENVLKDLEDTLQKTQKDLDNVRKGKDSEFESITGELSTLRETNKKLEAAIQSVADEAAARVRESELKAYKEEKIRSSKVQLTELVDGSTEEEIDSAIQKALEREQAIREDIRKSVHSELSANLPQPLSIDGQHGRGPTPNVTAQNREAVARLKGEEYQRRRQQLLEEAKQKVGLP